MLIFYSNLTDVDSFLFLAGFLLFLALEAVIKLANGTFISANCNYNISVKKKIVSYKLMTFVISSLLILVSFTIVHVVMTPFLLTTKNTPFFSGFDFFIETTLYSSFWQCFIILFVIMILYSSFFYLKNNAMANMEFSIIVLFLAFFLCCLISANDIFVFFVAIIGFSINTYVLILSNSANKTCCEAAIKYFYLSAFSTALLAFSIWVMYILFLSTNFFEIEYTLKEWDYSSDTANGLIFISINFMLLSLFFKLAAFPCHLWAPAVYEGSPYPVMAFFLLPIKIAILILVFKLFFSVFKDFYFFVTYLLWISVAGSMLFGSLSALVENKLKKFLAYSSINQIGFLLIGITANTTFSLQITILYLIIYSFMNAVVFTILLNTSVLKTKRTIIYLTDLTSFCSNNFFFGGILTLVFFSMASIPPLAGFFGKYYLLLVLFSQKFYFLTIIALFTSLLSTYYYLKIIKLMLFDSVKSLKIFFKSKLSKQLKILLNLIIGFLVFFGLYLEEFSNLILTEAWLFLPLFVVPFFSRKPRL